MRFKIVGPLGFAVVAVVVAVGAYFATQMTDGKTVAEEAATPTPRAVAPASPGGQLPVAPGDIQLRADGKYFVPDRGDGCAYEEVSRYTNDAGALVVGLQAPNCSAPLQHVFLFVPDTGELEPIPVPAAPSTPPAKPPPVARPRPEDVRLGAEGDYFIPDKGDGCAYEEVAREVVEEQLWVVLESSKCGGQFWFAPETGDTRFDLHPTPRPTPTPTATPVIEGVPRTDRPSPSEIKLGPDGKYFIPDRGDGCPWTERGRLTLPDGTVQVIFETKCAADFAWFYRPSTGEIGALAVSMVR